MPIAPSGGHLSGRRAELDLLDKSIRRVVAGQPHAVFVEGEAGIGKTALADAGVRRAAALGFGVAVGRSEGFGWDRPFAAILSASDVSSDADEPGARQVADLVDSVDTGVRSILESALPEQRARVVDACVDLVRSTGSTGNSGSAPAPSSSRGT